MSLISLLSHGILNVKCWLLSCHSRDLSNQMGQQKRFRYLWHMRKYLLWMPMLARILILCLSFPLLHELQVSCKTAHSHRLVWAFAVCQCDKYMYCCIKILCTGPFENLSLNFCWLTVLSCFCSSILGTGATRECNGSVSSGCGKMSTGLLPG